MKDSNNSMRTSRASFRNSAINNPITRFPLSTLLLSVFFALATGVICIVGASPSYAQADADSVSDSLSESVASSTPDGVGEISDSVSISAVSAENSEESYTGFFFLGRWNLFLFVLLFSGAILYYTNRAKRGDKLFIRKIAGLEAIEEAVGRATEMGRTVLFIPGLQELDEIQTIAGLTILDRVAKITAEYETPIVVPVRYPLIYAGAQETVKQSYVEAGRKDSYNEDMVRYVAGEQFAYTAHVNGWMMREKPAANIYMGAFFAESLLLAETGFAAGAIQIAGTAEVAQLPFFITACDYTLIGEELYAASAYLSHEPLLLGGLKGQDFVKAFLIATIILGTLSVTIFDDSLGNFMTSLWNHGKEVGQW